MQIKRIIVIGPFINQRIFSGGFIFQGNLSTFIFCCCQRRNQRPAFWEAQKKEFAICPIKTGCRFLGDIYQAKGPIFAFICSRNLRLTHIYYHQVFVAEIKQGMKERQEFCQAYFSENIQKRSCNSK